MTPAEVAAILRRFNEWRRGDETTAQPDPCEIGEAIDAAVEMIDRLEAAESDALEQARLNGMGSEREAALMAKLEVAEKDIALKERIIDSLGFALNAVAKERDALLARIEAMERPASSVPEDVMRDAERYRYLRARDCGTAGVGCWLEAEGRACDRGWLYGVQLDGAIDTCIEMLEAATEAKP